MNKRLLALAALPLLAAATLAAQTTATLSPRDAADAFMKEGKPFTSDEAGAIKARIEPLPAFSDVEAYFLIRWLIANYPTWEERFPVMAAWDGKCANFTAQLKEWRKETTGWTPELIKANDGLFALRCAKLDNASPEFRAAVFDVLRAKLLSDRERQSYFKWYRASLPAPDQIAATQEQKAMLLAKLNRNEAENAWLAEVSADLIALQLDRR